MTLRILLPAAIAVALVVVWTLVRVVGAFLRFDEESEDRE